MFQPSFNRYNTRPQVQLDTPLRKTNTLQRALSYLGMKVWTRISHSTNNGKTMGSLTHSLKREISDKKCR